MFPSRKQKRGLVCKPVQLRQEPNLLHARNDCKRPAAHEQAIDSAAIRISPPRKPHGTLTLALTSMFVPVTVMGMLVTAICRLPERRGAVCARRGAERNDRAGHAETTPGPGLRSCASIGEGAKAATTSASATMTTHLAMTVLMLEATR